MQQRNHYSLTMKKYLSEDFFNFFKKLAANNHRDWFEANRNQYENAVKKPFENLVDALLSEISKTDKRFQGVQARDCIFRINRDVRFSKDKSPYKLNRSAILAPGGKKDLHPLGFYLELGPESCGFYAGVYMPDTADLLAIREHIAQNLKEFSAIISDPDFKKQFGEVLGEKQKRLDIKFKNASEKQPLLFNKQFYIHHEFPEKKAMGSGIVEYLLKLHQSAHAYGEFLQVALDKRNDK